MFEDYYRQKLGVRLMESEERAAWQKKADEIESRRAREIFDAQTDPAKLRQILAREREAYLPELIADKIRNGLEDPGGRGHDFWVPGEFEKAAREQDDTRAMMKAAREERENAVATAAAIAVAEVDAAVAAGGEETAALNALRAEYAAFEAARVADADEADARLVEGKKAAVQALDKARADAEATMRAVRDESEARLAAETSKFQAGMSAMEKASAEAQAAATAKAMTTLEATRTEAAQALSNALQAADAERAELETAFSDEAKRAREAFETEIKAYNQRLSESSGDLSTRHAEEIEKLVAEHAEALSAAFAAKDGTESQVEQIRNEYEQKLEETMENTARRQKRPPRARKPRWRTRGGAGFASSGSLPPSTAPRGSCG